MEDLNDIPDLPVREPDRRSVVNASEMGTVMSNNLAEIVELWEEKMGLRDQPSLDWNVPVEIGRCTEPLNLKFFDRWINGDDSPMDRLMMVIPNNLRYIRTGICATPDGLLLPQDDLHNGQVGIVETKHTNTRTTPVMLAQRYAPQLHAQMYAAEIELAFLSVFFGNEDWAAYMFRFDHAFAAQMIQRTAWFLDHLKAGTRPAFVTEYRGEKFAENIAPVSTDKLPLEARIVDMSSSNAWAEGAATWLRTQQAAQEFKDATTTLKDLFPANVVGARGHGVYAKRSRSGSVTITKDK